MATISSRNAAQASSPEHNSLGVPHPTRRSDPGTQGDRRVAGALVLGDPGGTGRSRHDPPRIGARPGAKMARRRRRRVACGARSAQRRRGRRGAYAGHLQQGGCGVDRCASRIRRGSRHVARAGQLRQVFDACAELAAFLRRAIAEAPHTVLDLAGEAGAAQEPFAPEAMGRAVPSRRRGLGEGLRLAAQDERSAMAARPQ
jgi:hypothetical protein